MVSRTTSAKSLASDDNFQSPASLIAHVASSPTSPFFTLPYHRAQVRRRGIVLQAP